ncbi:MAG: alpha-L-fucosidase [Bacteroidales bacterium]|nr:alpha-L-fucosidase [Bacteroidales bacterium]
MKNFLLAGLAALAFVACGQSETEYYVKHVEFPEGASLDEKVDMASRLVPSEQQLAWQQMGLTAFLHFGINTFTNREWGDGKEDPALFNPTDLDADQWVKTLSEAGFKMVIITAKHHDGFCLWPTETTDHSVASSPWKDGQGDVVREVREACDRYGVKFGVYLSPWDRHAPCYGDSTAYNDYFIRQLTELLTNYGEVHEVWFDGACGEGPSGRKQEYDWDAFYETIQRLQPNAVMSIMGDDVRWVGNENGVGRETEWSATVLTPGVYARSEANNKRLHIVNKAPDLGSRRMLERAQELFWYPSEVDVSIRPGWFYHKKQNGQVKSLKHLVDIYFQSVGYNSTLLLNVPPDKRGRINEADSLRLMEFAAYLDRTFSDDRVVDGDVLWKAAGWRAAPILPPLPQFPRDFKPGERPEGQMPPDFKPGERPDRPLPPDFRPAEEENEDVEPDAKALKKASKVFDLQPDSEVNVVMLQENIAHGQRVESFTVEACVDGQWMKVGEGTTIGYKRLLRFPAVKASALKVTLNATRSVAEISRVAAYYAEVLKEDANEPGFNDIASSQWKIMGEQPLTVDLGKVYTLAGVSYIPDEAAHEAVAKAVADSLQDYSSASFVDYLKYAYHYRVEISKDGRKWLAIVPQGEFGNIMNNPVPQVVAFGEDIFAYARYIRFDAYTEDGGQIALAPDELGAILAWPDEEKKCTYIDIDKIPAKDLIIESGK